MKRNFISKLIVFAFAFAVAVAAATQARAAAAPRRDVSHARTVPTPTYRDRSFRILDGTFPVARRTGALLGMAL